MSADYEAMIGEGSPYSRNYQIHERFHVRPPFLFCYLGSVTWWWWYYSVLVSNAGPSVDISCSSPSLTVYFHPSLLSSNREGSANMSICRKHNDSNFESLDYAVASPINLSSVIPCQSILFVLRQVHLSRNYQDVCLCQSIQEICWRQRREWYRWQSWWCSW